MLHNLDPECILHSLRKFPFLHKFVLSGRAVLQCILRRHICHLYKLVDICIVRLSIYQLQRIYRLQARNRHRKHMFRLRNVRWFRR